jgi:hypothetical protein
MTASGKSGGRGAGCAGRGAKRSGAEALAAGIDAEVASAKSQKQAVLSFDKMPLPSSTGSAASTTPGTPSGGMMSPLSVITASEGSPMSAGDVKQPTIDGGTLSDSASTTPPAQTFPPGFLSESDFEQVGVSRRSDDAPASSQHVPPSQPRVGTPEDADHDDTDLDAALDHLHKRSKDPNETPAAETVIDPKDQNFASMLAAAVDDGDFTTRGALGQRFTKATKKGTPLHDDFKKQKSVQDKRNFRVAWAAASLKVLKQKKVYERSYQEIDVDKGQYLCFARIAAEEGGDVAARRAAFKYCEKAAKMQGRWVSYNLMTERWEYLYVKRFHIEEFKQAWSLFVEHSSDPTGNAPAISTGNSTGSLKVEGTATGKGKRLDISPGKMGEKANGDPETPTGKSGLSNTAKSPVDKKMMEAMKVKAEYAAGVVATMDLTSTITNDADPTWAFANNPQNLGVLEAKLADIKSAITPEFRNILISTSAQLKKDVGNDSLLIALTSFIETLKPKVEALTKERSKLLARYRASIR